MNLDAILLAMVRKPTSGYELKAAFDRSANHFWPAERSQIYRTLKRLEQNGLLRSRTEPSDRGPDRRVYSRNPNTGESPEAAVDFRAVRQTIMHGPGLESYIVLPVLRDG